MFSTLSSGALGLDLDHSRAVDLAAAHGFGGVDPDLGRFRSLGHAGTAEHAAAVREGPAVEHGRPARRARRPGRGVPPAAGDLPTDLELLAAAGVTRVGTWIRPMHQELDHRQNCACTRAASPGRRPARGSRHPAGPGYIGPKTFWSTERFPSSLLREARELIAETGAANVGLTDTYHWYTAGEDAHAGGPHRQGHRLGGPQRRPRGPRDRRTAGLDRRLPFDTGVIDLDGFLHAVGAAATPAR